MQGIVAKKFRIELFHSRYSKMSANQVADQSDLLYRLSTYQTVSNLL